jgi:hypothetical protein
LIYREPAPPKASAKVYDFALRQTEASRVRQIAVLERENALLSLVLSETRNEIARLRKLLAAP